MRKCFYHLLLLLFLGACSPMRTLNPVPNTPASDFTTPNTETPTIQPSSTPVPPSPTPNLIKTICSPLGGETLKSISEILTQPFKMPVPGNDDGHQGADFAFYRRNDKVGIEGLQVLAAMEGKVVTILNDRWPYGNAVIIETPLNLIDPVLKAQIHLPELQPTIMPAPRVNCPSGELSFNLDNENQSLYVLYGHLQNPVALTVGESVNCGQVIGAVGNTGYSSNPHLHFETRVGPSGARFDSMAYYTVQSTESERYNYCVWRVSNLFQLFDPMQLLSVQE